MYGFMHDQDANDGKSFPPTHGGLIRQNIGTHWATRSFAHSLVRSLVRSLTPELVGKCDFFLSQNQAVLNHSGHILGIEREQEEGVFLDAFSHLYKRVCPSVGPSVRPSVRRSVRHTRVEIANLT